MTTTQEALRSIEKALVRHNRYKHLGDGYLEEALSIINKALQEQPAEQEPVALETVYETIIDWDEGGGKRSRRELARRIVELYTAPPQREWVSLTDDEIFNCFNGRNGVCVDIARAIEAKLKEKNCGE